MDSVSTPITQPIPMKTKKNLFRRSTAAALLSVILASSPAIQAATFTWTGADAVTGSWAPTSINWDVTPTFNNTTDLIFNDLTRATSNEIGFNRTVRSITFGDSIDGTWTTNMTSAAVLTFAADTGNASLDVNSESTANITFNGGTGITGSQSLTSQLEINHNGSGLLAFNRQTAGAGGITKTGTGTFLFTGFNANSFTGPVNVNGGRLVLNNTQGATQDLAAAVAINLGGGTLEARTTGTFGKTLSQNITVSAASTLAYKNETTTSRQLTLNTGSMVLNAPLTVQNISTDTSLANAIVINRNLTGTENVIVETYNNVNSDTGNFSLGRVGFGGANASWSGDLVIRQGTAEVFGDSALGQVNAGTGDIILGETANAFGAGFLTSAGTSGGKTIANNIIVRSGGFRTIRGGSDHSYTFSGNIALEGDLTVHNGLYFTDKLMSLTGNISGAGDLDVTAGTLGFITRLSGDNSLWNGDLTVVRGNLEIRGASDTSAGTGLLSIGATGNTNAANLVFAPGAAGGATLTYENHIIVTPGGTRNLNGGGTNHNVTLTGNVTLDGDLTVNHTFSTADRRINLNGPISGNGGLTVTRTGGSTETTLRMAGTNTYLGDTSVATGASLALANTCSLTSNVVVQAGARIGGPGTLSGNLSLADSAKFYFYAVGIAPENYVPMQVAGTVSLDPSFGVASIVGGSRGEAVPWASYSDGTYTLIANPSGDFSHISNFGSANAFDLGDGRAAYFQNGGGLQLVIATSAVSGFDAWKVANGTTGTLDEDHDNDGVDNGTEYFLGGNTSTTGFTPLPGPTNNSVTWTKAAAGYDGVYDTDFFVETSETLAVGSWVTAPLGAGAGQVLITGNTVQYTFPTTGPKKFARLKVTGP